MNHPSGKIPFQKPWLSDAALVSLLQRRGLVIADATAAEQFLSHLSYYRFSGYCPATAVFLRRCCCCGIG